MFQKTPLVFLDDKGDRVGIEISAVVVRVGEERAAVIFVDNAAKIIYGQIYISGPDLDRSINKFSHDVMTSIQAIYSREVQIALGGGKASPSLEPTMRRIKHIIEEKVRSN